MRPILRVLMFLNALAILPIQARADAEIVIAIRYLQAEGTSHSHLYLYREDGKLLRQLTKDNSGQDSSPIFAPDGKLIIFTREKPHGVNEFWSVDPLGKTLKKLDAAPEWYVAAKTSAYFTNLEAKAENSPTPGASPESTEPPDESPTPTPSYKSPDGAVELVLREDPNDEADQVDMPGHGAHYLLRDLKSGTETPFANIAGFEGAFGILHERQNPEQHFLFDGTLHLAFFDLHLNSSDGTTVFALDLPGRRFVRLSANWATPFPLPGESAFLTFTEDRYVPIPGSTKTANCWYIERWDGTLNHIRYARENTAAISYGFSMYRPGKNPAVINFRRTSQTEE
ncbi:MAG TPA: hypothetical protein VH254_08145 [Candidatus Udaeobacter sp.]|nr:hypothetical protein [Candidatus Udaeobacter sp.]